MAKENSVYSTIHFTNIQTGVTHPFPRSRFCDYSCRLFHHLCKKFYMDTESSAQHLWSVKPKVGRILSSEAK